MIKKLHLVQKTVSLTCTWVPTGNPRMPMVCVWTESKATQPKGPHSHDSRGEHLADGVARLLDPHDADAWLPRLGSCWCSSINPLAKRKRDPAAHCQPAKALDIPPPAETRIRTMQGGAYG